MGLALRVIFSTLFILGGCVLAQPPLSNATTPPTEGEFFFANGSKASLANVLAQAKSSDYILIGETHTVACDHIVQAKLIAALAKSGMRFTVGLEMFSTDQQAELISVNDGRISLTDFAEKVDWADRWGFPYPLYQPIIEEIYANNIKIYALNIPFDLVRKISAEGIESLTPEERGVLPANPIPPLEAQKKELKEIHEKHVELMSTDKDNPKSAEVAKKSLAEYRKRFFLIQSLWDTGMAEQAIRVHQETKLPMVILAGAGHVENGWGIAYRLSALSPDAKILLIVPWRDTAPMEEERGDFQFYCPLLKQSRLGFTLRMEKGGAVITFINEDSSAHDAGFAIGDKIVKVGGMEVESMMVLHRAGVKAANEGKDMVFTVIREGEEQEISMPVPKHPHSS